MIVANPILGFWIITLGAWICADAIWNAINSRTNLQIFWASAGLLVGISAVFVGAINWVGLEA